MNPAACNELIISQVCRKKRSKKILASHKKENIIESEREEILLRFRERGEKEETGKGTYREEGRFISLTCKPKLSGVGIVLANSRGWSRSFKL